MDFLFKSSFNEHLLQKKNDYRRMMISPYSKNIFLRILDYVRTVFIYA